MSTHATIKYFGKFDFTPDYIEDEGFRFEINCPGFLWADTRKEAEQFLNNIIRGAQAAKKELAKLPEK